MKRIFLTAALFAGLSTSPVMAQDQHEHGAAATSEADQATSGMMMDSEAMQAHRQKMQEMRTLMQQAHAASDPAERQRLMAEHRQKMQEHMAGMMEGDNAEMMQACRERMTMMHDMMGQMATHQNMSPSQ